MAIHNDTNPIKMSEIFAEFRPGDTFANSNMGLKSYYSGGFVQRELITIDPWEEPELS